jgi:acylphosphatase
MAVHACEPTVLPAARNVTLLVARRFFVRGRVQGVGFRWFVQEAAQREGTTGWVRNVVDGSVEALVEGDQEAVANVERAIRLGPRGARVSRVVIHDEDPSGAYHDFSITSG